jgi:putative phage-type endonuclease
MSDIVSNDDRRHFVGGSDIAKIINVSPWGDAFRCYLEKTGALPPNVEETRSQRRGRLFEGPIADMYVEDHGATVQDGGVVHFPDALIEHIPASVARAQIDRFEHAGNLFVPLEIKSTLHYARAAWGESGTDDVPTYYATQVHWQIAATAAPFGRLVALIGDDLRVYTIQRDERVIEYLVDRVAEFWRRIELRDPPSPTYDHERMLETLRILYPNVDPDALVYAKPEHEAWRVVLEDAAAQRLAYEKVEATAKAHLLHAMGNAAAMRFNDGRELRRSIIRRGGYTVEPTEYIDARIAKPRAPRRKALPQEQPDDDI